MGFVVGGIHLKNIQELRHRLGPLARLKVGFALG